MSANPVISAERLEEIRTLRAGIGDVQWRSMRDGNQYRYGADGHTYLPVVQPEHASRVDGLTRLWNPHAAIAFMKLDAGHVSRFTNADADFIAAAPQIADDCLALAEENARLLAELERLRGDAERMKAREQLLWRWAYSLNLAAARAGLALRNAEQREAGETNNWPAQSEWHELVSSSHSVFTRAAREVAGIDHDAFLAFVRGEHGEDFLIAAEELYEAAIDASRSPRSSTAGESTK